MVDSIIEAIQNLKLWASDAPTLTNGNETEDIIAVLNQITETLTIEGSDKKALADSLVQNNIADVLLILLQQQDNSNQVTQSKEKAAEIVAELAKTDSGRKHSTHTRLIACLLELLANTSADIVVQACRALGNICYDNDHGRSLVHEQQGEDKLLQFLQSDNAASDDNEQLRTVATGFLLNLINTYEVTQDRVLDMNVLSILCNYLSKYGQEEDVCIHILMILNCLADSDNGRKKIIEKNICGVLVGLMEMDVTTEVVEAVLELTGNIADDDIVKYQLATTSLCHNLIKLLKTGRNTQEDEPLNVTKVACDLIVLLLTGDDSMEYLYGNGQGMVYKEITKWLTSKDETLQTAGALGIGNLARKDGHCIRMVAEGVAKQLLELMKEHNTKDGDIRLQHAILSALRNLAIPEVNKDALLDCGIIDILLPMFSVETFPVVFKLLGTLRMLTDGKKIPATKLGVHSDFIPRLVEWCATEDHPGVKGEANRLQAWLIKNSQSVEVMSYIVDSGGLSFLVSMTTSEHEVMQNEALIALSFICTAILDNVEDKLISHELSSKLHTLLSDESIHEEVKCNALTLIAAAISGSNTKKIKEDFVKAEIPTLIRKMLAVFEDNSKLNKSAENVNALFESG